MFKYEIINLCLLNLIKEIENMRLMLLNNYIKLDPYIFYKRVRIFLNGFENGIEFKGISNNMPLLIGCTKIENKNKYLTMSCYGASAAQCSIFPCIDLFFGLTTQNDEFLTTMKNYMPYLHRQFIVWIVSETRPNMAQIIDKLKQTIVNNSLTTHKDIEVITSEIETNYKNCIVQLRKFRTTHMKIAHDYIVVPASNMNKGNVQGTGGSSVLPYLQALRDQTKSKL